MDVSGRDGVEKWEEGREIVEREDAGEGKRAPMKPATRGA